MLTRERAGEILRTLAALPPDKVAEVQDFALFLRQRCAQEGGLDESDTWTEEDLSDLTAAVLAHAEPMLAEDASQND